jgi:hypothetical protein
MAEAQNFGYTVIASGDSQMQGEAALLAKAIEEHVPYYGSDLPEPLRFNRIVTNDWKSFVALGVTFFVAQRLGGKFLDDVYAILIQPRLKPVLEKLDTKLNGGNRKAQKVFTVSVWYAEYGALVAVAVLGHTFDEVVEQIHLIPTVHSNALNWLIANKFTKPVHYYKIENGKVNAAPLLLDHLAQGLQSN